MKHENKQDVKATKQPTRTIIKQYWLDLRGGGFESVTEYIDKKGHHSYESYFVGRRS